MWRADAPHTTNVVIQARRRVATSGWRAVIHASIPRRYEFASDLRYSALELHARVGSLLPRNNSDLIECELGDKRIDSEAHMSSLREQ